eukprot:1187522-Prorocentrum_minimum.AAC.1
MSDSHPSGPALAGVRVCKVDPHDSRRAIHGPRRARAVYRVRASHAERTASNAVKCTKVSDAGKPAARLLVSYATAPCATVTGCVLTTHLNCIADDAPPAAPFTSTSGSTPPSSDSGRRCRDYITARRSRARGRGEGRVPLRKSQAIVQQEPHGGVSFVCTCVKLSRTILRMTEGKSRVSPGLTGELSSSTDLVAVAHSRAAMSPPPAASHRSSPLHRPPTLGPLRT